MNVLIVETETGKLVATVPVNLQGMNYKPSEQEHFDEAWRCAVADKIVEPSHRGKYSFQLIRSA